MFKKLIIYSCITLSITACGWSTQTKDRKIYLTYLYYQKLADKEAGCEDKADTNCLERFNKIWPTYSDSIVREFKIDDHYLDEVISKAIEEQANTKNWALNNLSEDELQRMLSDNK